MFSSELVIIAACGGLLILSSVDTIQFCELYQTTVGEVTNNLTYLSGLRGNIVGDSGVPLYWLSKNPNAERAS